MSEPLMNIRTFLRGGYRGIEEPTTIISGMERLFVVIPESWRAHETYAAFDSAPRPAHPEPEGVHGADRVGQAVATADGRTEAPSLGGTAPPASPGGAVAAPLTAGARRPATRPAPKPSKR